MGNITFLGVNGSGKLLLARSLLKTFAAHEQEGWSLRPESRSAVTFWEMNGRTLTPEALLRETEALSHFGWSVVKDSVRQQTLDILDYPGDVYHTVYSSATTAGAPSGQFEARIMLSAFLKKSEQVFVIFDLAEVSENGEANEEAVRLTHACLDYLKDLPNQPQVTLVLTQFDDNPEAKAAFRDPKAYRSRCLPSIANAFPKVDVRALSAGEQPDAAVGIEPILALSLLKTPALQSVTTQVLDARKEMRRAAYQSILKPEYGARLITAFTHLSCENPEWKERLPWFLTPEDLITPTGLVSARASDLCKSIVDEFDNLLPTSQRTTNYVPVMKFLERLSVESAEAKALIRALKRGVWLAKKGDVTKKKARLNQHVACGIAILSFLIMLAVLANVWFRA